jgi:N-carbamoylputrescine amidase
MQSSPVEISIALIQLRCEEDPEINVQRARERIIQAHERGAMLICLPELFKTQYFCQSEDPRFFDFAEPIPGPTTELMQGLARDLHVVLVVPLFERRAPGLYHNSVIVIDADGHCCGIYRKMHIPDDPLYYEKYYFTPGDLGFRTFATAAGKIGTLICWDQWFPEAARLTVLQGAEILLYPTAIGWHPHEKSTWGADQYSAWQIVQRSHAIANGVFVAAVNRVGHEGPPSGGLEFWGGSFVSDPFGRVLAQASHDHEEILLCRIDKSQIEAVRRNWPFLRDRRIDAYQGLTSRFLDNNPWR